MKTLAAIVLTSFLATAGCGYHDHYHRSEARRIHEDVRRAGWEAREELRRARMELRRELRQAGQDFRREMREAHRDMRDEFGRW